MKILLFQPHETLLSPQGALHRLNGFLSLLDDCSILHLIPLGTPGTERLICSGPVQTFLEPRLLGRAIPYLLDWSPGVRTIFKGADAEFEPDLAIFNFPWGLSGLRAQTKGKVIYFSHGVEADFTPITLKHLGLNYPIFRTAVNKFIKLIERRACRAADLVITISEEDSRRLRELYQLPADRTWHLPQPITPVGRPSADTRRESRLTLGLDQSAKVVLFHGSWGHFPNRQAIELLVEQIAPICRNVDSSTVIVIAGAGVPKFSGEGIVSLGFVENLDRLIAAADIAVMPILCGGGVRMKAFDYLRAGCPIVSTRKGVEGLALRDGVECVITEDSVGSIAAGIFNLLSDESLRQGIEAGGLDYLRRNHDPAMLRVIVQERLLQLRSASGMGNRNQIAA